MASKHGSLLAGAAGFIADVWTRMDKEARKRGATDEDIHAIVTERDEGVIEEMAEKFAEIIARARQAAKNIFAFMVEAGSRTTEEVLAATHHTLLNEVISSKNFPMRPQKAGERTIEFLEFDHNPTSEEVLDEAERRGLVRPSYEDALLFNEAHPNVQGVFVFLHEPWQALDGHPLVVCLDRFGSQRVVLLHWFGLQWYRNYRFGFLRKSQ